MEDALLSRQAYISILSLLIRGWHLIRDRLCLGWADFQKKKKNSPLTALCTINKEWIGLQTFKTIEDQFIKIQIQIKINIKIKIKIRAI